MSGGVLIDVATVKQSLTVQLKATGYTVPELIAGRADPPCPKWASLA
jgi:hypothetical protein